MFRFSPKPNHAHLINWKEWSEETFRQAQGEDKPIYLSLSAVWCHWCHVFDETTLSDPQVIEILNRDFICIRVDADKNPHIQSRYLAGGWPTSAFLTPRRDVIVAGTYIYPEDFRSLTAKVSEYYKQKKGELYARVARYKIEKGIERERKHVIKGGLTEEIPEKVFNFIKESYDPVHGGFGTEPKFPQAEVIEFLIKESLFCTPAAETYAQDGLEMAKNTLNSMMQSELWDTVEKGFFRYCTKADWTVPHYEKMLEGNAGLLKDYLSGYQATGNESYRSVAEGIIYYTGARLCSPSGGFYGSQDADEHYYRLDAHGRSKITPPKVDETIYTDWNGQLISQYLLAYQTFRQKEVLEKALKSLSLLKERAYEIGHGMCHYICPPEAEEKRLRGLLSDQVHILEALLIAYQITAKKEYLHWAVDLMDYTIKNLGDKAGGGFFDVPEQVAASEHLYSREKPFRENSLAARILIRLYYLTGEENYKKEALNTLRTFLHNYEDYSLQAAIFALAVREYLTYPIHIVIVGMASDTNTLALHQEALQIFPSMDGFRPAFPPQVDASGALPWKLVQVLDPVTEPLRVGQLTFPQQESAVAYVCKEGTCSPPLLHPEDIKKFLKGK
ncbi:MAG TPA: thioredoxin domain-containing protein [Candidatus Hypogeohydataceae bacterium YC41]